MGFLDPFTDGLSVLGGGSHRRHRSHSRSRHHKKKRSKSHSSSSRSRSRHRSKGSGLTGAFLGIGSSYMANNKSTASRSSFFGLGDAGSRSSFFGSSRPSYYKRSPRHGFMHRALKQVKRLFRDLVHYAKRHPWKVFFLVLMPLITGGFLTALLARFGLRMPPSLERLIGMASRAVSGDSIGLVGDAVRMASDFKGPGSVRVEKYATTFGGGGGGRDEGWGDNLVGMAKMFI